MYRAYKKDLCYITFMQAEDEEKLTQLIDQGINGLGGFKVQKYEDHRCSKQEAYRAKMMLHGRFPN